MIYCKKYLRNKLQNENVSLINDSFNEVDEERGLCDRHIDAILNIIILEITKSEMSYAKN